MKRAKRLDHRAPSAETARTPSRRRRWIVIGILAILACVGVWWRGEEFGHWAARRALATRDPESAIDWLRWTGRYFGPTAETHLLFARAYRKLGQISAAQESLHLAIANGVDEGRLLREDALLHAQVGQFPTVEPYLGKLLAEPLGEEAEIYESFAIGLMLSGRLTEAVDLLSDWEAKVPRDPQPHFLRGVMHRDVGWPLRAETEFRQALERDARHADASLELAIILMRTHRYEEAVDYFRQALVKPKNEGQARVGLARCCRMLGDVELARTVLTPIVEGPRPNVGAVAELSSVEYVDGNYEQALRRVEQVRDQIPKNVELNYGYASILAALGRHREAEAPFEFAFQARRAAKKIKELTDRANSRPDDLESRCAIARLSLDYGDPRDAAGWAQSALAHDPNYAPARDILARIQQRMAPARPVGSLEGPASAVPAPKPSP